MPKRIRPYGSAVDAESAGLARGWRSAGSEGAVDLADAMTVADIARQAAEIIRALTDLTSAGVDVAGLDDARDVIGSLERIGQDLPQMSEQLARILVVQGENGQIRHGSGQDPDYWVGEAVAALEAAGQGADMMTAALSQASETLAGLRPGRGNGRGSGSAAGPGR
jgi:hypothetical protein